MKDSIEAQVYANAEDKIKIRCTYDMLKSHRGKAPEGFNRILGISIKNLNDYLESGIELSEKTQKSIIQFNEILDMMYETLSNESVCKWLYSHNEVLKEELIAETIKKKGQISKTEMDAIFASTQPITQLKEQEFERVRDLAADLKYDL